MFRRVAVLAVLGLVALAPSGRAEPALASAVAFDPASRLFTYSYAIDYPHTAGPASPSVTEIQITSLPRYAFDGGPYLAFPEPVRHTEPAGWDFHFYPAHYVDGAALSRYQSTPAFGIFAWTTSGAGTTMGQGLAGFSVTTWLAPNDPQGVRAGLWHIQGADVQALGGGFVLAPAPPAAPEPSGLVLCAVAGLVLAGLARWSANRPQCVLAVQ